MRTSPQPPHKEKYPTLQKHIFHFNPPLEISKEFERKYLKIRQIAFTNPLNSWKTWAPPHPSLILRLIMIMIIIKEHFWLPCHCYGCSSNEWWTVIIMRSQFWYLRWVSGECMAEMRRQEFGPNSLTIFNVWPGCLKIPGSSLKQIFWWLSASHSQCLINSNKCIESHL